MKTHKFDSNFWKKYFKVYDILNLCIPYIELKKEFIKYANVRVGDTILDAGGGTGNVAVELFKNGADVVLLDFSEEALKICKEKESGIKTIYADLSNPLNFKDNSFDGIVSNNVIYTISEDKRDSVFKEFYRILKPEGKIIISNIKVHFSPFAIYKKHILVSVSQNGLFKTLTILIKMIYPTLKMFYYNSLIQKNNQQGSYSFLRQGEQENLLKTNGFTIKLSKLVYADQAVMTIAEKNQ
ncbi:MAG: class I SAM-dependent methyltransferase [bacterium]|nr:class I SAM-dependent methyltransferase [bacterium]